MKTLSHKTGINIHHHRTLVLIIEDDDDQWFIIRWAFLQSWPDVKVVRVLDAVQAASYLATAQKKDLLPDLILLDLYLPTREDGWALLETIKLDCFCRRVPVVILSSSDLLEDIEQSYYLHCSSYIIKPTKYLDWSARIKDFKQYWHKAVALPC